LPWIAFCGVITLLVLAYFAQRKLWQIDMRIKESEN